MHKEEIDTLIETAREMFPEIPEGAWTLCLTLWMDRDYHMEYFHTFPDRRRISLEYKHGEIRLIVCDMKLGNKPREDIFLFKTKKELENRTA